MNREESACQLQINGDDEAAVLCSSLDAQGLRESRIPAHALKETSCLFFLSLLFSSICNAVVQCLQDTWFAFYICTNIT